MNTCQAARHFVSSVLTYCPLLLVATWQMNGASLATAQDKPIETSTWAIAADWLDDSTIIATTTSGLHYQPSQLVVAQADEPNKMTVIGRDKASMWTALPLGDHILTTNYEGAIQLFDRQASDSESGEPKSVEAEARWIRATAKLPSGSVLLGTQDGKVLFWDAAELAITRTAELHTSAIFDIAISDDGSRFATATETGAVGVFDSDDMQEVAKWSASSQSVWAVTYAGDRLVTAGADRQIKVWDPTGHLITAITATDDWGSCIATIPDTDLVIIGSLGGSVTLVDTSTLFSVAVEQVAQSGIWSLAVSPDSKNLLAATRKHGLQVIDISSWPQTAKDALVQAAATMPPVPQSLANQTRKE